MTRALHRRLDRIETSFGLKNEDDEALMVFDDPDASREQISRAMAIAVRRWGLEAVVAGSWQLA